VQVRANPIPSRLHNLFLPRVLPFPFFFITPLLSSGNNHQPIRYHWHAAPVRPRLSVFSLLCLVTHFSFTLDAVTTRAPTTCRTNLDFVVGLGMYLRPSRGDSGASCSTSFLPFFCVLAPTSFPFPFDFSVGDAMARHGTAAYIALHRYPPLLTSTLTFSLFLTLFWTAIPTRISTLLATAGGMHDVQAIA
jgi:hypothetical protein